jgi:hypothetical protein
VTAIFATILQARLPVHVAEGSAAGAFGDVYRVALVIVLLAWCLAWGLRQPSRVAKPDATPSTGRSVEREPVLAG